MPEIWCLVLELAAQCGAVRLNRRPGCWEHSFGPWRLALNAHPRIAQTSWGAQVSPNTVYVERNGVAAGEIGWSEGEVLDGHEIALIDALQAEIKRKGVGLWRGISRLSTRTA